MKKDIKYFIIGTLISLFLFAFGMFLVNNASFNTFLHESPTAVKIALTICIYFCIIGGFCGSIIFYVILELEYHCIQVSKRNCKIREEIKSELPKRTEFSVAIANIDDENLNELLCENLKCTASFDGSTIYIEFSLPEKVSLKTDDILWFNDVFDY